MSADIMALYGPQSRIGGYPQVPSLPPISDRRLRLEQGLERLYSLFMDMIAKRIELLDAEAADPDLEPSLGGFGGMAGSRDEREADYPGHSSDDEPLQAWAESQSRRGRFAGAYALEDDEHSLGSLGGTGASGYYVGSRYACDRTSQMRWADGRPGDLEEQCEGGGGDDACEDEGAQDDREPSLAGLAYRAGACGNDDDREEDCEDEGAEHDGREPEDDSEPDSDGEPSLGSMGGCGGSAHYESQEGWARGNTFEREEEHDGREPDGEADDADHEPSLAALEGAQFYVNAPRFLEEVDAELNEVAA